MIGFIGKLFGSDKAASSLIDNVSSGIDKLFYTDEEKAGDRMAAKQQAATMVIKWMESTQGQNLARRLIALIVTGIWVLQYVVMMCLSTAAVWVEESMSERLSESAVVIGGYAESMNGAMMLILGFYFAAPHLGDIAKGALMKFGGSPPQK